MINLDKLAEMMVFTLDFPCVTIALRGVERIINFMSIGVTYKVETEKQVARHRDISRVVLGIPAAISHI